MNSTFSYENLDKCFKTLKLDINATEFSAYAQEQHLDVHEITLIENLLDYLYIKKSKTTIDTILRMSRLPLKKQKTFGNFDFSVIRGKDLDKLTALPSLSAIHAHRNIAFIGPSGTGKTHLAQAFGYECCMHGMKTYFIKMTELRDKFTAARRAGKEAAVLNGLVRPSCLIIDEVGHCEFDKENTRLFFDLIDRRYNQEGSSNIVFTSNKTPALWRSCFNEDDALLCALDRIFDDAQVFNIKGESFRGKNTERFIIQSGRVKAPVTTDEKEVLTN